jgi:hypothetical protein
MFTTHASIIEAIGISPLAEALGLPESHIRTMKSRNSIPPRYWFKTVELAGTLDLDGVTHEQLARIASLPAPQHVEAAE